MPNRKVLLTGASGYIASQILPAFQDQYDMALIDVNDSDREGRKVSGVAFEDNFSLSELVQAANDLAGDTDLNFAELESRAEREPTKKISKVLGRYYYEI
ncbi:MAG: hypothetical protein O6918_09445, partial [Deltaproteobacteria bacterium]|nr:hypothetical protein [Deltaproteobacteria bacterium]